MSNYFVRLIVALVSVGIAENARAFVEVDTNIRTYRADGAWHYSYTTARQDPGESSTFFATTYPFGAPSLQFIDNFHPDLVQSAVTGGYAWKGGSQFLGNPNADDTASYQLFSTWIQSDTDQTIPVAVIGDDGHSLFVDGTFKAGGGFGAYATYDLELKAGVRRPIDLVGYNGPGSWSFGIGEALSGPPATNPVLGRSLAAIPGVRINADGYFPTVAGSLQVNNRGSLIDSFLNDTGASYASSFTTGNSGYLLDSITLDSFNPTDVRIWSDNGGKPYAVEATLSSPDINGSLATYRSTGLSLAPNSTYWVTVLERGRQSGSDWASTNSPAENSPSGWSIGNSVYKSTDQGENWSFDSNRSGLFSVNAQEQTPIEFGVTVDTIGRQQDGNTVVNSLIGDGGAVAPTFSLDLDTSTELRFTISAPTGFKFVVDIPDTAVAGSARFGGAGIDWIADDASEGDTIAFFGGDVTFQNLVGAPPTEDPLALGVGDTTNSYIKAYTAFAETGDISFTGITVAATYDYRNLSQGATTYRPRSDQPHSINFTYEDEFGDPNLQFVRILPILDGDFNGDGRVDIADYTAWRDGLGTKWIASDYNVWAANFGATIGAGSGDELAAVPEPSTFFLGGIALFATVLIKSRRTGGRK